MSNARQVLNKINEALPEIQRVDMDDERKIFRGGFEQLELDDLDPEMANIFESIAKEMLGIDTLKTQSSDSLDFHDVSVWGLVSAMYRCAIYGAKHPELNEELDMKSINKLNEELDKYTEQEPGWVPDEARNAIIDLYNKDKNHWLIDRITLGYKDVGGMIDFFDKLQEEGMFITNDKQTLLKIQNELRKYGLETYTKEVVAKKNTQIPGWGWGVRGDIIETRLFCA